ncbi:unnamed protein product [Symbiodinium sp. CCMP2456]|nr:unnamed protein product [Symbiodinium sp. CCMP2456]
MADDGSRYGENEIIGGDGIGFFVGLGLVTASSFLEEFLIAATSALAMWLTIMIPWSSSRVVGALRVSVPGPGITSQHGASQIADGEPYKWQEGIGMGIVRVAEGCEHGLSACEVESADPID